MMLWPVLLLALLPHTFAADESCLGRCEDGFDSKKTCQCDSVCKYYQSCCSDFEVTCGMRTRGDTFVVAEDDDVGPSRGITPSFRRSAHQRSFTTVSGQLTPTQRPTPGPRRRQRQRPKTPPPPTQTPPQMESVPVTEPTLVSKPVPLTQEIHSTPEPPQIDATVETTTVLETTTVPEKTTVPVTTGTTEAPDPDAMVCSGTPFDSFMQLKNGSIYAFRGEYFFVLDQRSVLPGYPKLIKDVWGIRGPIDAAFTRVNCQGKTYIFKGNKYWRFDNGVLDEDYPRDIGVGFDKIPDYVDAAFALPAPSHHGKEKAFFFKGDQYYVYEFLHQPSHEECVTMSETSPSTLFRRYTDMYHSNYERFFGELFSDLPQHHDKHHFINKDWKGLKSPVDAAMAGRIYVTARTPLAPPPPPPPPPPRRDYQPDQQWGRQQGQQWGQQYQQNGWQWGQRRSRRSPNWGSMAERGMSMGQDFAERGMEMGLRMAERRMEMEERLGRDWDRRWDQDWDQDRRRDGYRQNNRGNDDYRDGRSYYDFLRGEQPVQSVYFFKGDKYYRVDLKTKRVDRAVPPYPRSIAKYWLGCSGTVGAEK